MLWDAAWDQQNVIQGKVYSDHIADFISGGGGASGPTPGTGTTPTPGGSAPVRPTPGEPTPGGSPSVPATPPSPGGGGGAGMLVSFNFLQELITRSLQLPHISVTAFSQTDLFLV